MDKVPTREDRSEKATWKKAAVIFTWIHKGGMGKTTTTIELATAKAALGYRCLVVGLDQNSTLSKRVGMNPEGFYPNLHDVFLGNVSVSQVIKSTGFGFDIIPGHPLLRLTQESLEPGDEGLLHKVLSPILGDYDFIILDTEPGIHPLNRLCVSAANYLLIPLEGTTEALDGLASTITHLQDVIWPSLNRDLQIMGILPVKVRRVSPTSLGCVAKARQVYGDKVFPTEVFYTDGFSVAYGEGLPSSLYKPSHQSSKAYREAAKYVVERVKQDQMKETYETA